MIPQKSKKIKFNTSKHLNKTVFLSKDTIKINSMILSMILNKITQSL